MMPPDQEEFARIVKALGPYLDQLVFVGAWCHRLLQRLRRVAGVYEEAPAPILDLPAVTVRALEDRTAPQLVEPLDGQHLVDHAGGQQDATRANVLARHRGTFQPRGARARRAQYTNTPSVPPKPVFAPTMERVGIAFPFVVIGKTRTLLLSKLPTNNSLLKITI